MTKSKWISEVKKADKKELWFLHPCQCICEKDCDKPGQCPPDKDILINAWKGKVIASNAFCI
jgi:hypothetical protein